jgi:hypothetical protein
MQSHKPGTLFEYINGAADFYLSYDCRELNVAEYMGQNDASLNVEVYRHGSPAHAFGVYSQERPAEGQFLGIGSEGYVEPPMLNFLFGDSYIKINGYGEGTDDSSVLMAFASEFSRLFGDQSSYPGMLECLPKDGRRAHTETFIAKNFMGYEFFRDVFAAEYDSLGMEFRIFVMRCPDSVVCRTTLDTYLQSTDFSNETATRERYVISDPYHGTVYLQMKQDFIWGILGLSDTDLAGGFLSRTEEAIERYLLKRE